MVNIGPARMGDLVQSISIVNGVGSLCSKPFPSFRMDPGVISTEEGANGTYS